MGISSSPCVRYDCFDSIEWDRKHEGCHALEIASDTVVVRGCEFRRAGPQIELGKDIRRAVIAENVFSGPAVIANHSQGNVQNGGNANGD